MNDNDKDIRTNDKDNKANEYSKVVIITGATSGIGLATAKQLAAREMYIIGVGRSKDRCSAAEEEVKKTYPKAKISYLTADLSSLGEVEKLGAQIRQQLQSIGIEHIDVLINNAGTVSNWYISTVDGFELQFAVNHLASFRLTYELLPLLSRSPEGTVIAISSGSHYRTKIHWKDVMLRKHYNCLWAYKQTKLANVLFITELNRRLVSAGNGIKAFAVDPGLVNTDIGIKGLGGIAKKIWEIRSKSGTSADQPAKTIVWLVAEPDARKTDKVYWKDKHPLAPSRYSQQPDVAKRFWELSERMSAIRYEGRLLPWMPK